ncbi:class I SAM-dependent methyltransferase [Anthocerotibacter panamensis]|uniref:class I SAM-dependent methyltransferase n=1 Tax=Anthocerotibacter panamensis TaxID=2857077 RepID=UPI001C40790C|nr:class I SAM-dependent methyltransferase [Anthocerotibacter panamensis]
MDITAQVQAFYNRYPYPPEPLLDIPPLGWNWRWSWPIVHSLYYGYLPEHEDLTILDAGCGTGFGSQYLGYQNPQATVTAIDLSEVALEVGRERCRRAGVPKVQFQQGSLLDLKCGSYDFINCVGVLHHLPDPVAGLKILGERLAPGGLMHLFVYSELGRREIALMQEALRLFAPEDATQGVRLGRELFRTLPPDNPLRRFEQERWATENREDSSFADMYLQVQETCFNVYTLLELIEGARLHFVAFSNPEVWQIERLLGNHPELQARAQSLCAPDRYRLIELLDPVANHYELFLSRAPLHPWVPTDSELLAAHPHRAPYIGRWPSRTVFNYCYQELTLSEAQVHWLKGCDGSKTVAQLQAECPLPLPEIRHLTQNLLVLLARAR